MIFGNIRISPLTLNQVIDLCERRRKEDSPLVIHFLNANSFANSLTDPELTKCYNSIHSVCLPDGKPLAFALKIRFSWKLSQIRGPDFFQHFIESQIGKGYKHFLIGPTNEILRKISATIENNKQEVVGTFCPPQAELLDQPISEILTEIKTKEANIVWIGLSSPKQDRLAHLIANDLGKVVIPIGAAFLFHSKTIKEAPKIYRFLYLEWLYRLFKEPKRLFKRYLIGNLKFLWAILKYLPYDKIR